MKPPSPNYAIGDVVPMPADADHNLATIQMNKRGLLARRAKSKSKNQHFKAARKIMDGLAENERLRTEPFELARTFLRRKGFVPVCKLEGKQIVGRRMFATEKEVMAFARSKGWEG